MKKIIILQIGLVFLLVFLASLDLNAQLKIGTNVKTLSSNIYFEVESVQGNKFIITKDSAKIGIGTSSPTTKFEINNGSIPGAIKIIDGTEGVGKVLTSDANGLGVWTTPSVNATNVSNSKNITNSNGIIVTGGTGATLQNTSLRLDSSALAKMIGQSPVKDSINAVINTQSITVKNVSIKLPLLSVGDVGSRDYTLAGVAIGDNVIANPRTPLPFGVNLAYIMVSAANTITFGFTGTGSNTALDIPFDIKVLK